jgi:hypothetical protein
MRLGLTVFRAFLVAGWLALLVISVQAFQKLGGGAAGQFYFGDFAHPWRAQFNLDLGLHLLLAASWMIYRTRNVAIGIACAVLAINFGAVFTLAYILISSIRAKGDLRKVLLGDRYPA